MTTYDEAPERANKYVITLNDYQFRPVLFTHFSASNYLIPFISPQSTSKQSTKGQDRTFHSNNELWEAIRYERFRRTDINMILDSFFLFEWFPRSPGLYHQPEARRARDDAMRRVMGIEEGVLVFDPYGKRSMLEGGVGNIRLQPIKLDNHFHYFMSASSNGSCHQGFPVAVPEEIYNPYYDEIVNRGTVVLNLVGKLRFIPHEYAELYSDYTDVPQLYLQVTGILPPVHPKSRSMEELRVSVAVSFTSDYEGSGRIYATFVNFDPSNRSSFKESLTWMEEEYVSKKYRGRVITDFDEQESHFRNAPFSLAKVMSLAVEESDIRQLGFAPLSRHQQQIYIHIGEYIKYKTTESQIGSLGDNAQASDFTQIWKGAPDEDEP